MRAAAGCGETALRSIAGGSSCGSIDVANGWLGLVCWAKCAGKPGGSGSRSGASSGKRNQAATQRRSTARSRPLSFSEQVVPE
jgi:hypothetical protein